MEVEMVMSYIKHVRGSDLEFRPLSKLITHVRVENYGDPKNIVSVSTLKNFIKENYGISIGEYNDEERPASTPVDFGDEQNYILFLLKWT